MVELERVLRQIKDGEVFIEQMKEFDMEKRLAAWQMGLVRLESVWKIIRSLEEISREVLAERMAAMCGGTDPQIFIRFAEMARANGISFEETLIKVCGANEFHELGPVYCLRQLVTRLINIELEETTACLVPSEKEGFIELSLRMKGLSPLEFLAELAEDLETLRRSSDPELRQKNIIAYSWLLDMKKKKTEKILNSLGIGPANGARVFTIDPNDFETEAYSRVMLAATTAIPLAEVNIDRYLRSGRLPRVGVLTMEASDFWN